MKVTQIDSILVLILIMWALGVVMIGTVCAGISSTMSKKLSALHQDKLLALVYQYISIMICAFLLNLGFSVFNNQEFLPMLSGIQWAWIVLTSVVGYGGIYCLFQAYHRTSAGIALIVANLATFIMYFVNIYLIDGSEVMSGIKMLLALVFFVIVSLLLISEDQQGKKHVKYNSGIAFALRTAICRAFYFSANTYFIKSAWLLPVQSLFVTERGVALCAFVAYGYARGKNTMSDLSHSYRHRDLPRSIGVGVLLMSSIWCMYYGYQHLSSSLVNVVRLFSIVVTAVCCWLWLGEKLTKGEVVLIGMAFVVLVVFVIV